MKTFTKCKACHNIAKNKHKIGPTLVSVIGRKAGTAKDEKGKFYRYSKAMKAAGDNGIVWNDENLEKFLTKPKKILLTHRVVTHRVGPNFSYLFWGLLSDCIQSIWML